MMKERIFSNKFSESQLKFHQNFLIFPGTKGIPENSRFSRFFQGGGTLNIVNANCEESDNFDGRFVSNNKEAFKIGSSIAVARKWKRQAERRQHQGECRRPGARENFSIIAGTVIKPNKREITASTRPHYPKSWKSKFAGSGFNGFRKGDRRQVEVPSPTPYHRSFRSFDLSFFFLEHCFTLFTHVAIAKTDFDLRHVNYSGLRIFASL